jgi:hypothetical protein
VWWRRLERSRAGYLVAAAAVAALTAALKLLGGRIWVEGRAGGAGARVVFTLPIGDEDRAADRPRELAPEQAAAAEAGEMNGVL